MDFDFNTAFEGNVSRDQSIRRKIAVEGLLKGNFDVRAVADGSNLGRATFYLHLFSLTVTAIAFKIDHSLLFTGGLVLLLLTFLTLDFAWFHAVKTRLGVTDDGL